MKTAFGIRLIIGLGLAGLLVASEPALAQVVKKKLPVKRQAQKGTWLCWAACAEMIMVYLEADPAKVSQCIQASDKFDKSCCGSSIPAECDKPEFPDFSQYGFSCKVSEDVALEFDIIKEQIDDNKPVAFSWFYHDGGGHMLVASGYKKVNGQEYVWVIDPAKGISSGFKPYEYYDQGGDGLWHSSDFYDITKDP